jgi:hypothetical protein
MTESNIISLLSPDQIDPQAGFPSKAICGHFSDGNIDSLHFIENKAFVDLMHSVIADHGPKLTSLSYETKRQGTGYIYIIDLRTPNGIMGNVPPEDIIGAFKVENGKVVENSYHRNDKHKIFTKYGLVKLPKDFLKLTIDQLIK